MQNKRIFAERDFYIDSLGTMLAECSAKAISARGRFTIAFAGGSAATNACEALTLDKFKETIDWSKWFVFLCDERFVEADHPDSNYKAIHDGLLTKVPTINPAQVFKLKKIGGVSQAANYYEADMRRVFCNESLPRFDLIVLGMGPDGHICSLFPKHALLREQNKWVTSLTDSPKPPPHRITFTLKVVNNAADVVFIATGKSKADMIRRATECLSTPEVPASLVKPTNGNVHWFMDEEAASMLKIASKR